MRINLMYHTEQDEPSGYGRMGENIARELATLGVDNVGDVGTVCDETTELAHTALWLSTPPHVRGWYEGQFASIFTMWESSDMPPGFRENLHHFDRIFVPSRQNEELFGRFHPDVRYVPLGVGEEWHYRQRRPVEREFRFFTAGFGPRKGAAQVAAAFLTVFPGGKPPNPSMPTPTLTIRSRDEIAGPGIRTISSFLGARGEVAAYADAHCFVSGSKGEGWGLMPLQAIAQGMPTILGDAHGHHAFAHYGIPLDTHPYSAKGATFWGDGGEWWEPDFGQMCEAMWDVYCHYDRHAQEAAVAALQAAGEFTWQSTALGVVFNLEDALSLPMGRLVVGNHLWQDAPEGPRTWHAACPRLFHIRVNRTCDYRVNGVLSHFVPGQDYYEAADLKRAMIAAGQLDLSTWDPNDLGVEDGADVEALRAKNATCPVCHQPFNRDTTLAELAGGEL